MATQASSVIIQVFNCVAVNASCVSVRGFGHALLLSDRSDYVEILTKRQIAEILRKYYIEHYGTNDADIWYEQPAANVWIFSRNGKIITLKCHILTGMVTRTEEE